MDLSAKDIENEKKLKLDEFLPIYSQVKKDKEQGTFEDFLEALKLYDKEENGTMMSAELSNMFLALGEKLTESETEELLKDCMEPEDEEGFTPYEQIEFAIEMFTDALTGKLDAMNLGDVLRVCGLNPSLDSLEKLGATKKAGEKMLTMDDITKAYIESKKDIKNQGCYEDFVECLKLYDKEENGKMIAAELSHSLLSLGEKLTDDQVDRLFTDCLPEEDDDGMIEYDSMYYYIF
ncbi:myosin light chain 1 3 [Holotrichia oblita]|uniref:Myosin light chain 1 3 n=1 Tax=Holotrichia oblita TaxID=644536 RepID=A0ACB9SWK6_HOLOL|nr:myosin light chain 1 3 [Holotrichia oblita]